MTVIGKATATLVNNKTITPEQFANAFKQSVNESPKIEESDIWDYLSKFVWSHSKEHVSCPDKNYDKWMFSSEV